MKSSAARAKRCPSLSKPANSPLLAQADVDQQAGKSKPKIDERSLSSNLPDPLPVLPGESDLMRIYFADLIADVLKGNS